MIMVKDVIDKLKQWDGNEAISLSSGRDVSNEFDIEFVNEGRNRVHFKYKSDVTDEIEQAEKSLEKLEASTDEARGSVVEIREIIEGLEEGEMTDNMKEILKLAQKAIDLLE